MSYNQQIMIVDDEPDLLRMVEIYLKTWKFDVVSFNSPFEALEFFKKNPALFSLVLTDVRMPGMSGIDLGGHMLKIKPDLKIMLMTAYQIDSLDLKTALPVVRYGDILRKPFRLKEICEGVKKQLEIAH